MSHPFYSIKVINISKSFTIKDLHVSGDLPEPGIESMSPVLQADFLPLSHQGSPPNSYNTLKGTI